MRFLLQLLLSLPLWALGQSSAYTVSGTVTDPEGEPLSRASVMVLLASDTTLVAFGTEAGLFQRAGIPTVICGPGSIAQAHTEDEYIEVAALEEGVIYFKKFLASLRNS